MPDKTYRAEMERIDAELHNELVDAFYTLGTRFFQEGRSLAEIMEMAPSAMSRSAQSLLPLLFCRTLLECACQDGRITEAQLGELIAYIDDLHARVSKGEQ